MSYGYGDISQTLGFCFYAFPGDILSCSLKLALAKPIIAIVSLAEFVTYSWLLFSGSMCWGECSYEDFKNETVDVSCMFVPLLVFILYVNAFNSLAWALLVEFFVQ